MHILILGGNSDIGIAIAQTYAKKEKAGITLASRNLVELEKKAADIAIRHQVETFTEYFDATAFDTHPSFFDQLDPKPDGVVLAFGETSNQGAAQNDFNIARNCIDTNYTGAVRILEIAATYFEKKQSGFIICISSVAGDRGRQSNYIYGSAKAGLSVYLSGLRHRLFASGIHVMTVKPGFVRTKMTQGMDLPERLTMMPDKLAEKIYLSHKKRKGTCYASFTWWGLMTVIRLLPEWFFKRTKL